MQVKFYNEKYSEMYFRWALKEDKLFKITNDETHQVILEYFLDKACALEKQENKT